MDDTGSTSDRYFDLSLRLLTIFVLVSLACCVGFLSYRWLEPLWHAAPATPLQPSNSAAVPPEPTSQGAPAPADEILMDPHKTFRCVEQGRVTFSDRACDSGSVQIIPLNPSQQAGGGH